MIRRGCLLVVLAACALTCVAADSTCDSSAPASTCRANLAGSTGPPSSSSSLDASLVAQLAASLAHLTRANAELLAKFHALERKVEEKQGVQTQEEGAGQQHTSSEIAQPREAPAENAAAVDPGTQSFELPTTPPSPASEVTPTPPRASPSVLIERVSTPGFRLSEEDSLALHLRRGASRTREQDNSTEFESAQEASRELLDWARSYYNATENGGEFPMGISHSRDCARDGECRGVYAARNISQDTAVVSVPQEFMLDASVAFASPWTQLRDTYRPESEIFWMSIFLMYDYMRPMAYQNGVPFDYGPDSPFTRFYSVLPSHFSSLPAFFDLTPPPTGGPGEDFNIWLRGSPVLNVIKENVKDMNQEYQDLCRILVTQAFCQLFTKAQYLWARTVVTTRAFGVDLANPRANQTNQRPRIGVTLVPAADMLNHAVKDRLLTTWNFNDTTKFFEIRAIKNFDEGQEITTTYGSRSNGHLFTQYGFVLDVNPFNEAVVSLRVPLEMQVKDPADGTVRDVFGSTPAERAVLHAQKLKILHLTHPGLSLWSNTLDLNHIHPPFAPTREVEAWEVYRCGFSAEGRAGYFSTCHAFARYAVATPTELLSVFTGLLPSCGPASGTQSPLSYANELRAVAYLGEQARLQKEEYERYVEEEHAFLHQHHVASQAGFCDAREKIDPRARQAAGCLTQNQLNMLRIRIGEKELLQMLVDIATEVHLFSLRPEMSPEQASEYLTQRFPPEARGQGPFLYVQHLILPLYAKEARWEEKEEARRAAQAEELRLKEQQARAEEAAQGNPMAGEEPTAAS